MRLLVVVLLVAIVGHLVLCRGVRAQNGPSGGGGKFATSLCAELILPNEYGCTEHQAVTDDGFILGLQNMPSPRGVMAPSRGPPVLLVHGILCGGDIWCNNNPQESLPFLLADAGFNVWIGNHRAIQWSHGHETLTPDQDAYWAWTYDELASYDLKALTQFVYTATNNTKLFYVGHSQGTLVLFAGLTGGQFKTEILGYLNAAVLLAPVAFVSGITAPIVKVGLSIYADKIITLVGDGEFNINIFYNITCGDPLTGSACNDLYYGLLGEDNYLNQSRLGFYTQYFPQPTSSFNVNHYGQSLRSNTFQFYDKGEEGNIDAYGQSEPPTYDLTTFPASLPLQLWCGGVDGLGDPTDVADLLTKLPPSNLDVHTLPNYGHGDVIVGTNAFTDIFDHVITYLQLHSSIQPGS